MPDINSHGAILTGRGRVFLDDHTVAGQVQSPDGHWRVSKWTYPNGQPSKLADKGCTAIAARAGHWRAWLNGELFPRLPGVTDAPVGLLAELQSARGVSADDGTIGLILDFHAGLGLRLLAADGSHVDVANAFPRADSTCIVSRSEAFWMDHAAIPRTLGLPVPVLLPGPIYWPQVLRIHGEWWITYHSTDDIGVVMHPFDSFHGYQVAKPPAFYLAARMVSAGVLIAWGTDPGDEGIGQRVIDVTREPRTNLQVKPEPEPDPQPEPEPEPMSIPNLERIVKQVDAAHPHLINQNTADTVREFYWRAVWALHQEDQKFGFLSKSASENHQVIGGIRVAVDAVAYKGSDEIVDILRAAGDGPGKGGVAWSLDERRPSNVWIQPFPFAGQPDPDPEPDPEPEPEPQPGDDVQRLILAELRKLTRHLGA